MEFSNGQECHLTSIEWCCFHRYKIEIKKYESIQAINFGVDNFIQLVQTDHC